MIVRLTKTFRFEAAHYLPTFPDGHKCRRLHGHSFVVDVTVAGDVPEERGYLIDYGQLGDACEPVRLALDHYCLNDIDGLENPTAENISRWIWDRLVPAIAELAEVVVRETCTTACHYRGPN